MEPGVWSFFGIRLPSWRRRKLQRILHLLYRVSQIECMKEVIYEIDFLPDGGVNFWFTTTTILNRGNMIDLDSFYRYKFCKRVGIKWFPFQKIRDVLSGYNPVVSYAEFSSLSDFENILSVSKRFNFYNDFHVFYRRMLDNF